MKKTALAVITLIVLLALPDHVPALAHLKGFDWSITSQVLEFTPRRASANPLEDEAYRLRPDLDPASYSMHRLLDPRNSLDPFFAALRRTELKEPGAVTRVVHYGDSPTTGDLITADVRALLQQQFGDGGHGFHLIARPWAWYAHRGIECDSRGWQIDPANQSQIRDGLYGLGGVSFRGQEGAAARLRLRQPGHTALEISYLSEPGTGSFAVFADETLLRRVDTNGPEKGPRFVRVELPPRTRWIEVQVTSGTARLFGMHLEKEGPGIVYSSLGLNGAYVSVLARFFDGQHWAEQLKHHRPHLVIINYGTNESMYQDFIDKVYSKELGTVITRVREAVPDASLLIMSPMDRGRRDSSGGITTVPLLPRLVAMQERLAAEQGVAFFNTFQAMGGPGTMGKWYAAEPRLVGADFIHPMPAGARIVGNLLYKALLDGYNKYKLKAMQERLALSKRTGKHKGTRQP
ncbi:MAG: GDSL-type esterase/lipase family protein [Bryobacteraceae bacterium]|nr:GDSL-type esterase/lipase family protein [Bryobacteraceae bacterium]